MRPELKNKQTSFGPNQHMEPIEEGRGAKIVVTAETVHLVSAEENHVISDSTEAPAEIRDFVIAEQSNKWTVNRNSFDVERRKIDDGQLIEETVDTNPAISEARIGSTNKFARTHSVFRRAITIRGSTISRARPAVPLEERPNDIATVN